MCKEGIRIGRRTVAYSQSKTLVFAVELQLLPANAARIALSIAIDPAPLGGFNEKTIVYTESNNLGTTYGVHGWGNYQRLYRIEEYGQLVLAPQFAITSAAGGGTVWITELYLTDSLEHL